MQKLYKVAFQRILKKIGAHQAQKLNVEAFKKILQQKNVPLSEIDETIFHKLPRQEVKNLVRNPCPINKSQQTSSEIVANAKAVRGALNIVEKKVCFKCSFVASCDKAFIEPANEFKIQDPLPNLLFTMKNLSQLENIEKIKNRSWFSGVRVCDSLNTVLDDLMIGGQQFKIFKQQRNKLRDEAEKQNQEEENANQLHQKNKKNKPPLKDIYAQVPQQNNAQKKNQIQGESAFEELSKGPQNIFKKKKSQEFIKIAQKYINNETDQNEQGYGKNKKERKSNERQQFKDQRNNQKRRNEDRRQFNKNKGRQNITREQKPRYQNRQRGNNSKQFEQQRRFDKERYQSRRDDVNRNQSSKNYNDRNTENFERKGQKFERNSQRIERNTQFYGRDNQKKSQRYRDESGERDPKIRRFSKQKTNRNYQQDQTDTQRRSNKLDKFYSQIRDVKSDQEQILSSFNRRQNLRSNKLPRDAKYPAPQRNQKNQSFSEGQMKEFNRLEKIPKILKTQFASKQDVKQRVLQETSGEQAPTERKGRRVKRG